MNEAMLRPEEHGLRLRLPATSANMGPGFDAVGLALSMFLTVEARLAAEFSLEATGGDAAVCGDLNGSLILRTYREVLMVAGKAAPAIAVRVDNGIPLGMGLGSSAAALLAGVALADHFGALDLGDEGILAEAARREGHPDNVAACWCGGFTVSAGSREGLRTATFAGDPSWRFLLAMQPSALSTQAARACLPAEYPRADAVFNLQHTALLVAAFASGRHELLREAMADRMHQPFRMGVCPLLPALLPLAGQAGVAAVSLSGAGPSVLIALTPHADEARVAREVQALTPARTEIASVRIAACAQRELL